MSTVKVKVTEMGVAVTSPFNKSFVDKGKGLGGKWDKPVAGAWNFAAQDEGRVRQLCLEVYGTDGTPVSTVTMHVNLNEAITRRGVDNELIIGPIQVLKKWNRDQKPKLGGGCIVVSGALQAYGGSRNNPRITCDKGTIVEVREVPVIIAKELAEKDPEVYVIVNEVEDSGQLTPEENSLLLSLKSLAAERLTLILEQLG